MSWNRLNTSSQQNVRTVKTVMRLEITRGVGVAEDLAQLELSVGIDTLNTQKSIRIRLLPLDARPRT